MRDRLGQIWLLMLLGLIIGLSVWLWVSGRKEAPQASEIYVSYEASRLLGCQPYVLNKTLPLDINRDGVREYLVSCDSSLSSQHFHFAVVQVRKKGIEVFMHFRNGVWLVGRGPKAEGGHWVIDRGERRLLFVDEAGNYYRLIWNQGYIELVGE
jgi:hypothetical protein